MFNNEFVEVKEWEAVTEAFEEIVGETGVGERGRDVAYVHLRGLEILLGYGWGPTERVDVELVIAAQENAVKPLRPVNIVSSSLL